MDEHDRGQSLQGSGTERLKHESGPGAGEAPHEVRRQHLARRRGCTEPRRLDDRRAEPVVALGARVSRRDADTDRERERPASGEVGRARLHRHRGRDGGGGTVEHGHDPVAEALHHAAIVLGDDFAQPIEVLAPDGVGGVVAQGREQLGRNRRGSLNSTDTVRGLDTSKR